MGPEVPDGLGPARCVASPDPNGALAVLLVLVAYAFLLNLPHPRSVELGFAYGVSAVVLIAAAWRLWCQTIYD